MSSMAILVDASACSWGKLAAQHGTDTPGDVIRALISFSNAHISMSAANKLLMLAYARGLDKRVIFNSRHSESVDASSSMLFSLRQSLTESIESNDNAIGSTLAQTLAHAICYLKRCTTSLLTSSSNSCSSRETARIVIISMSSSFGSEHSILMNLFFSVNKHGICVDIVSLSESSAILQQAADITSGLFLKVSKPKRLLKTLMSHVLCPFDSRRLFPYPSLGSVDFRAACVCHHQLVDQGWVELVFITIHEKLVLKGPVKELLTDTIRSFEKVCSVCLSVLCQFVPICTACGAVFKLNMVPRRGKKRKNDD